MLSAICYASGIEAVTNTQLGTDNIVYKSKMANGKQRVSAMNYTYDIAEGNIDGHTAWSKIGFTAAMTTAESDVWSKGGTYVFPVVSTQMAVVSSSANDTAAGTGVQSVMIHYLDDQWNEQSTIVTLNGVAYSTTTPTNIYRINDFHVQQAGSGAKAAGNISLVDRSTKAITYGYITAGFTHARNSVYTVPAGKVLYITGGVMGFGYAANQTHYARMYFRATQHDGVRIDNVFFPFIDVIEANGTSALPDSFPAVFYEKVDIKISGISTVTGTATSYLEGWLE
jgi:hypothetical protein